MRTTHARLINKAALTTALLTLTGLTLLPSTQAQELDLGQDGSRMASGTATLTDTGTTASGTYTYYIISNNPAPLDPTQNNYIFFRTYGPSTAYVNGGSIQNFETRDTSTSYVSGGSIGVDPNSSAFVAEQSSTVNISGGSITRLQTFENSTANVSGGSFNYLNAFDTSMVSVTGGSIGSLSTSSTNTVNVSGGSIGSLYTYDPGTIDFFGTDFTETPTSTPQNVIAPHTSLAEYTLTGILANGDPLNALYYDNGGTLEFNGTPAAPVPEASSVVSLGVLLVLGGLVLSVRRRSATAARET